MFSSCNEINPTLCAEIEILYILTALYFVIQLLQNHNAQFLIPNYEMNRFDLLKKIACEGMFSLKAGK
jgi:hypothetical protein